VIYSYLIAFILTDIDLEEADIWDDWIFPIDEEECEGEEDEYSDS
jgi:hypothetical protein